MKKSIIVAVSENGVIGKDGGLPWHLPKDLPHFKSVTMGKPVIMGRKTFESIGKPLAGRRNFVVSRYFQDDLDGAITVSKTIHSLLTSLYDENIDEVMIIGGSEIYMQLLPIADKIYLTKVHALVEGDTYFPDLDMSKWEITSEEFHPRCEKNPYDYSFLELDRVSS